MLKTPKTMVRTPCRTASFPASIHFASQLLERNITAEMHVNPKFLKRRRLDAAARWACAVGRINHLDVIGLVPRHHLVADDALEHRVHDRPLRRGFAPAPFRFSCGQFDHFAPRQIAMQVCRP